MSKDLPEPAVAKTAAEIAAETAAEWALALEKMGYATVENGSITIRVEDLLNDFSDLEGTLFGKGLMKALDDEKQRKKDLENGYVDVDPDEVYVGASEEVMYPEGKSLSGNSLSKENGRQ